MNEHTQKCLVMEAHLRNRWPIAVLFDALTNFLVLQNVDTAEILGAWKVWRSNWSRIETAKNDDVKCLGREHKQVSHAEARKSREKEEEEDEGRRRRGGGGDLPLPRHA